MTKAEKEPLTRLGVGLALNLCLWPVMQAFAVWSGIEREVRVSIIGGMLAAAALVALAPLFWRGKPWQVAIAFLLILLPGWTALAVLATICHVG